MCWGISISSALPLSTRDHHANLNEAGKLILCRDTTLKVMQYVIVYGLAFFAAVGGLLLMFDGAVRAQHCFVDINPASRDEDCQSAKETVIGSLLALVGVIILLARYKIIDCLSANSLPD